jgi:hypothetical protein
VPFRQAVGPTRGVASDQQCIEGRVTKLRNSAEGTFKDEQALSWFVDRILATAHVSPHTLCPEDFDVVFERQKRPTQRHILRVAADWFTSAKESFIQTLKTFMKSEAYGKVTDPRNITTISGNVKMSYSRYTYASQNIFKRISWYAFSKNPREIGRAVNALLASKDNVVPTDFSRWDGRVSKWLTNCYLVFMKRAFAPIYHEELESLFWAQYDCKARTANGVTYEHLYDMPSGSPHTSQFNTFDNAFINFLSRLEMGESEEEAWDGLGIYGGDDGLTANMDGQALERTCSRLGVSVKAKNIPFGEPVDFLGRIFHNAWVDHGDSGCPSHIDVLRQMDKFYVTASPLSVPNPEVLVRKAQGYLITDPNTPVISEWSRCILRLYPAESTKVGAKLRSIIDDKQLSDRLAGDGHCEEFRDFNWFATYVQNDSRFNNDIQRDCVIGYLAQGGRYSCEELSALATAFERSGDFGQLIRAGLSDEAGTVPVEIPARLGDDIVVPPGSDVGRGQEDRGKHLQPTHGANDQQANRGVKRPGVIGRPQQQGLQPQPAIGPLVPGAFGDGVESKDARVVPASTGAPATRNRQPAPKQQGRNGPSKGRGERCGTASVARTTPAGSFEQRPAGVGPRPASSDANGKAMVFPGATRGQHPTPNTGSPPRIEQPADIKQPSLPVPNTAGSPAVSGTDVKKGKKKTKKASASNVKQTGDGKVSTGAGKTNSGVIEPISSAVPAAPTTSGNTSQDRPLTHHSVPRVNWEEFLASGECY